MDNFRHAEAVEEEAAFRLAALAQRPDGRVRRFRSLHSLNDRSLHSLNDRSLRALNDRWPTRRLSLPDPPRRALSSRVPARRIER
ncbi:hypothetical protein LJR045_002420 [Microbacterium sp. LjRoot45]|uniref:hypothetical protein n=1 Tax=Microbacterium sp. LjRoot45 TaxID=3342329 RepID=UPI003ED12A83